MPPQLDVISPQQAQYPPGDWTPALGWGTALIGLAIIAGMARWLAKAAVGNPIPYDVKRGLEKKYGHWAVQTAIRVCPLDDIECIEREAQRLYQSRILRR